MQAVTDSSFQRDRFSRMAFAIASAIAFLCVPTFIGALISKGFEFAGAQFLFSGFGLALGVLFCGRLAPRYLVLNSANLAFVTLNSFSSSKNPYVPYGPGWHFSFPWEVRRADGNVPLNLMTENISEKIPSGTGEVTAQIAVQVIIRDPVSFYVASTDSVVAGLKDLVREWLADRLSEMTANDVVRKAPDLSRELNAFLVKDRKDYLLDTYGLVTVNLRIHSIDVSERMQSARDSEDQARSVIRSMAQVLGYDTVKEMFDAVRIGALSSEDIRAVREDVLAMAGVLRPKVTRLNLSGFDAKDSTAAAAIFAALDES